MELLGSPARTLISILVFMAVVVVLAILAYMGAGWSFSDASYMVALTVYTVGYGEVHPINTPYLHGVTMATMVLGCTGMILLTGALVQFLTITQLQQILGGKARESGNRQTGKSCHRGGLRPHRPDAGQGASAPAAPNSSSSSRMRSAPPKCGRWAISAWWATPPTRRRCADAGIARARTLATVLPNDAANVFIALSARSLNPGIEIIARGELPSTEGKLLQAGANRVVMPTHIGAERIAELILFPETARLLRDSAKMSRAGTHLAQLRPGHGSAHHAGKRRGDGRSIAEIETMAQGKFFILQVERKDGDHISNPEQALKVHAGDGVVIVGRRSEAARAVFDAPAAEIPRRAHHLLEHATNARQQCHRALSCSLIQNAYFEAIFCTISSDLSTCWSGVSLSSLDDMTAMIL